MMPVIGELYTNPLKEQTSNMNIINEIDALRELYLKGDYYKSSSMAYAICVEIVKEAEKEKSLTESNQELKTTEGVSNESIPTNQ